MQSDSGIISFTTSSLSYGSSLRSSSYDSKSISNSSNSKILPPNKDTNRKLSISQSIKREIRSFCCVFGHLTFKSCKVHSVKSFLLLLCLLSIFTSIIVGGFISAIITSLQTQFNFSTERIGYILSSFDIMGVFATPIISYVGTRFNKARVLAICNMLFACGCIVFTLPYFFGERYTISGTNSTSASSYLSINSTTSFQNQSSFSTINLVYYDLCIPAIKNNQTILNYSINLIETTSTKPTSLFLLTSDSFALKNESVNGTWLNEAAFMNINTSQTFGYLNETCVKQSSKDWTFYVFIIGQLLMSWGIAPLFPLGITYLCDNLADRIESQSVYTGFCQFIFYLEQL